MRLHRATRILHTSVLLLALSAGQQALGAEAAALPVASTGYWYDTPEPDQSDWSLKRVSTYAKSLKEDLGEPLALLEIPDQGIMVQVFVDESPMALERGAAWVPGTAAPGGVGNIVVAGHRDGFFRPLEGIPVGTGIELRTQDGSQHFRVTSVTIVDPLDISPLDPADEAVLTLITCHPFRYQGFAPDRYIVRAELVENSLMPSRSDPFGSAPHSGHAEE